MIAFVELTQFESGLKFWVNLNEVQAIKRVGDKTAVAFIGEHDPEYFLETPDEIFNSVLPIGV